METLHSGRNCWPVETGGIFVQIFHDFFFSFERIVHFFLAPLKMLSTSFGAKTSTLYSCQNSWPVGQWGIFVQILPKSFIYLFFIYIEFSTCFWDLWIYYLQVFVQKWRHCILVEILNLSELGVFSYKFYTNFFFLSKEFSISFLGPLNMLSASFGAKTTTLYSSQNTWPVGQKGIFLQILPEFFYLFIFQ